MKHHAWTVDPTHNNGPTHKTLFLKTCPYTPQQNPPLKKTTLKYKAKQSKAKPKNPHRHSSLFLSLTKKKHNTQTHRHREREKEEMAQSLELLLIQFLMPDNDARRQAEEQIKRLAKDPQVVPALVQHLRTAKTPNVRQLAAVLLRKKITGHWAKLSPQLKHLVKQSLIESITMEHRFLTYLENLLLLFLFSCYDECGYGFDGLFDLNNRI